MVTIIWASIHCFAGGGFEIFRELAKWATETQSEQMLSEKAAHRLGPGRVAPSVPFVKKQNQTKHTNPGKPPGYLQNTVKQNAMKGGRPVPGAICIIQ